MSVYKIAVQHGLSKAAALRCARALLVHHKAEVVIVRVPRWSKRGERTWETVRYFMDGGRIRKSVSK